MSWVVSEPRSLLFPFWFADEPLITVLSLGGWFHSFSSSTRNSGNNFKAIAKFSCAFCFLEPGIVYEGSWVHEILSCLEFPTMSVVCCSAAWLVFSFKHLGSAWVWFIDARICNRVPILDLDTSAGHRLPNCVWKPLVIYSWTAILYGADELFSYHEYVALKDLLFDNLLAFLMSKTFSRDISSVYLIIAPHDRRNAYVIFDVTSLWLTCSHISLKHPSETSLSKTWFTCQFFPLCK